MLHTILMLAAGFSAGWVYIAVTGPIFATRNPAHIVALVVGTALLLLLTR